MIISTHALQACWNLPNKKFLHRGGMKLQGNFDTFYVKRWRAAMWQDKLISKKSEIFWYCSWCPKPKYGGLELLGSRIRAIEIFECILAITASRWKLGDPRENPSSSRGSQLFFGQSRFCSIQLSPRIIPTHQGLAMKHFWKLWNIVVSALLFATYGKLELSIGKILYSIYGSI